MKKILILVACLAASYTVQAQYASSRSITETIVEDSKGDNPTYSRIFVGYTPGFFKSSGESVTYHGVDLGFNLGINLTKGKSPLYLELGLTDNMNFKDGDFLMSFNIPINITYRFKIGDSKVRIAPYAGIRPKLNLVFQDSDGNSYFDLDDAPNRFQFGGQAGVNFDFNKFYIGVGYNFDFTPIWKLHDNYWGDDLKIKSSGVNVNIGVTF